MRKVLGFGLLVAMVGLIALAAVVVLYPVPEPNAIAVSENSRITYADGTQIAEVGDVTRTSVPLASVPEHAQLAVLAAEDREFYEHRGVSPVALARAVVNNVSGGPTQGGSTITQQYVKNVFLTQERTVSRKVQEAILSVKLDVTKDKGAILGGYLNSIYFGRGAYGIEAASLAYYGHSASDLTLAESAALAGLIQSPGNYEPEEYPQALQQRFDYVLDGMVAQGWLPASQAQSLTMPAFIPRDTSNKYGGQTGYLVSQARSELLQLGFTDAEIDAGGLRVETTIDPAAQQAIADAVAEQGPQSATEGVRIGAASVDPATGGILAMYGGPDYVTSSLNNATQARAQAGSTFKPFALAAAYEEDVSRWSRWNGNSPRTIAGYTLENEGNTSYGRISLQRATERSVNTVFVSLANEVGIDDVMDAAYRAGLPQDTPGINRDLTFVLGSASPTPLEMASAYATFAGRGEYHEPYLISEVTDGEGRSLYRATPVGEQRFEAEVIDQVTATLQGVVENGTATRALGVGRDVAGKTGTTDDNKSAWFVGYGPQVATAVMLSKEDGNGNPVSLRGTGGLTKVFGSSFPLSIWTAYTAEYLAGLPEAEFVAPQRSTSTPSRSYDTWNNWNPRPSTPTPESSQPAPQPSPTEPSAPAEPSVPVEPSQPPVTPSQPPVTPDPGDGGGTDPVPPPAGGAKPAPAPEPPAPAPAPAAEDGPTAGGAAA